MAVMTFQDWRSWSREALPAEEDFVWAWLSLGIYQATFRADLGRDYDFVDALRPVRANPDHRRVVEDTVGAMIDACSANDLRIPWDFPQQAANEWDLPPQTWRDAALKPAFASPAASAWRIKVLGALPSVWIEPLAQLNGKRSYVSAHVDAAATGLRLSWPLRVGYFEENKPKRALGSLTSMVPAAQLSTQFALGRDHAKCDVLVYWGRGEELLAAVRSSAGRIKTNLLLLLSQSPTSPFAMKALLQSTSASGYVWLDKYDASSVLETALNSFVWEFAHNQSCDVALLSGLERHTHIAGLALSDEVAGARIRDVATALDTKIATMPPGSWFEGAGAQAKILRSLPTSPGAGALPDSVGEALSVPIASHDAMIDLDALTFDAESEGATALAELATAMATAIEPATAHEERAARYLQQQSFNMQEDGARGAAQGGFIARQAAEVDLMIGPLQAGWQGLDEPLLDAELFRDTESVSLTAWLTEPYQLPEPVSANMTLPRDGASTPCILRFTPQRAGRFEGRVTVLHHGRVLQTAVLLADVLAAADSSAAPGGQGMPRLEKITQVRHNLGDVKERRYFDLAFVENHTAAGVPRTVALSRERAWIADATALIDHMGEISLSLTDVAESVSDYADGLDGESGRQLIIDLARSGSYLSTLLMDEQLDRPGNNAAIANKEYIQIVSMRSEPLPIEFAYDFPAPAKTARVCEHWRNGVAHGKCPGSCGGGSRDRVCPMGFWSLSKVIERHQLSYEHALEGKQFYLQSEPTRQSDALAVGGPVVFSGSARVKADGIDKVRKALLASPGVEAMLVESWEQWASEVAARNPRIILSMPHTDGANREVSLEISEKTLHTIDLTEDHVCPRPDGRPPIVILLGCDVAAATAAFSRHVTMFNKNGAAVVVATIATVAGNHAAAVAALLATELLKQRDQPFRLGEVLRDVKRQALLQNLFMPLCVVAYGDADWRIESLGVNDDDV
jgi:hypothetical protein